jgi:DNA-binding response OmpR family regulator
MAQVLVVDRTASVREALAFVLELEGHSVAEAASGRAALEHLGAHSVDVVVIDPNIRDLPFDTFCASLRECAPGVRVVVMSLSEADVSATDCCAPAAFLVKPFAAPDLLAAVV